MAEAADEQYLGLVPLNLAIYNWEFASHCTSVPAYSAVYGGHAVNVGDNRYPWTRRAPRLRPFPHSPTSQHTSPHPTLLNVGRHY